jgi:CheY-like chemotaxis protein
MEARKNAVLFVDDEPHILSAIRRATVNEAFEAVFAGSGREALHILGQRPMSVIVTDMRMPEMDGLTLLKQVRQLYPKTVRIVLSGYTQLSQVVATVNMADIFQFIAKPWEMEEELLGSVRQAIKRYNLEMERDSLLESLEQKNAAYVKIFHQLEQKFTNEQKDMANIKHSSHWMFAFWKKNMELQAAYLAENKVAGAGYVDLLEKIFFQYLDILPTEVGSKTLAAMVEELKTACQGDLVIPGLDDQDRQVTGCHKFIMAVLQVVVGLLTPTGGRLARCELKWAEIANGHTKFVVTMGQLTTNLTMVQENLLKIGCSFLSEIGITYFVKVIPTVGSADNTIVEIIWLTKDEEEEISG